MMSHGNNGMRRMPIDDYERGRIHKMLHEGLTNKVIQIRTGRSKTIIMQIRHDLEKTSQHAITGE